MKHPHICMLFRRISDKLQKKISSLNNKSQAVTREGRLF